MKTRDEILNRLRSQSLDEAMGADLEDYLDQFGPDEQIKRSVSRFLSSANPLNRSATLRLLTMHEDTAIGLEADALLLHVQGNMDRYSELDLDMRGVDYLRNIESFGSITADRILSLLSIDDNWAHIYREWRTERPGRKSRRP